MYISYLRLVNFTGVFSGTGRSDIEIEFPDPKSMSSRVILFMGANGSGKSTTMSHLHPFAGSFDGREDTMVRTNEDGLKQIQLIDGDTVYDIEHHYIRSGKKPKTKSFIQISQVGDEKSTELNENGGVGTFKDVLVERLGLTEEFFKVGRLASTTSNFVELSAAQRKDFITSHLPRVEPYLEAFGHVRKKCSTSEKTMKYLASEISRYDDREQVNTEMNDAKRELKRRDKALRIRQGDVSVTQSKIDTLVEKIGDGTETKAELETELQESLESLEEELETVVETTGVDYEDVETVQTSSKTTVARLEQDFDTQDSRMSELRNELIKIEKGLAVKERRLASVGERGVDIKKLQKVAKDEKVEKKASTKKAQSLLKNSTIKRFLSLADHIPESRYRGEARMGLIEASRLVAEIFQFHSSVEADEDDNFFESITEEIIDPSCREATLTAKHAAEGLRKDYIKAKEDLEELERAAKAADELNLRPEDCSIDSCHFLQDAVEGSKKAKMIPKAKRKLKDIKEKGLEQKEAAEYYSAVMNAAGYVRQLAELLAQGEAFEGVILQSKNKKNNLVPFSRAIFSGMDPFDVPSVASYVGETGELHFRSAAESCQVIFDYLEYLEDIQRHNVNATAAEEKIATVEGSVELVTGLKTEITESKNDVTKRKTAISKKLKKLVETERRRNEAREVCRGADRVAILVKKYSKAKEELTEVSKSLGKVRKQIKQLSDFREKLTEQTESMETDEKSRDAAAEKTRLLEVKISKLDEYQTRYDEFQASYVKQVAVRDACDPKKGLPLAFMREFMASTEVTANTLFDMAFRGRFRVGFEVSEKEFKVPVLKDDGDILPDVSYASDGERALVKTIVSLALLSRYVNVFPILAMDEVDATLDEEHRGNFAQILDNQVEELDLSQVFAISHNENFRDPSVSVVLFPGHTLGEGETNPVLMDFS